MTIILEIARFDPASGGAPRFVRYTVEAEATDRILSLLLAVKAGQDPTLGFRKSCAHGVCGSDAMRINGRERLACKTLVKDVWIDAETPIRIEPLRNMPVQRDLMVDQAVFFEKLLSVHPYSINETPPPEKERLQTPAEQLKIEDATNCILCESCYSACPVLAGAKPGFIGPAACLQAARFDEDSRDEGQAQRRPALDAATGVRACDNHFECTRVCPRGIKVTKHINATKRRLKSQGGEP